MGNSYIHVVIVMGRVTVHTSLEEAGIIFTSSGQSSLWAPQRAQPGRCSIGRGWILFTACQPSITEKRLHSRGTFNPDAGFYRGWKRRIICFCAAHSLVDDAHVPLALSPAACTACTTCGHAAKVGRVHTWSGKGCLWKICQTDDE